MISTFPDINVENQDSIMGNTPLHVACLNNNIEFAKYVFAKMPKLCLKQNYAGETPIHLAAKNKNLELLKIFEACKHDCLLIRDAKGENPLFNAARSGMAELFTWFCPLSGVGN